MLPFRRILVPVDFWEGSQAALRLAFAFADAFEAEVEVVHVVWALPPYAGFDTVTVFGTGGQEQPLTHYATDAAQRAMDAFLGDVEPARRERLRIHLDTGGDPAVRIVRVAEERQADLIVLATHGRRGVSHALMGSVAERVVRTAPCPVATVRAGGRTKR